METTALGASSVDKKDTARLSVGPGSLHKILETTPDGGLRGQADPVEDLQIKRQGREVWPWE